MKLEMIEGGPFLRRNSMRLKVCYDMILYLENLFPTFALFEPLPDELINALPFLAIIER